LAAFNVNPDIIESLYHELINEIKKYRPTTSLKMVEDAYLLAKNAHSGQMRKSGEPFFIHPLSVALILAEIRTDLESITAAILHDVVEDTNIDMDQIRQKFGEEVALLVDGVTKIERVAYVSKTDEQAENYRKMFFHMSQDVRVLLIKIADRLHNMRTLEAHSVEKQREIAQETLDIYAPLAHRLGIARLRYELEDLGFKYTDRALYNDLKIKIEMKQAERQEIIEQLIEEIQNRLKQDGIYAKVDGRPKRFYSIYKKMRSQDKTLDQIYDLYAVRVLVNEVRECYEVLGRLHEMYTPVPGRFKDYIGMKKTNGYQSLHTTLVGPGEPFEVQIRTFDMHSIAEFGVAAHWKYKEGGKADKDKWLQEIMNWQRELSDNDEFLDALKMDLSAFQGHVYCFTPTGEVISLINGSCVIDFAYAIHSSVGNRMIGARVNGKLLPINHVLQTGDRVEIITSQNMKGPNRDWLSIVKTNQARSKINQWFRRESRDENLKRGRELLEAAAQINHVSFDDLCADGRLEEVLERFNCKNLEQLILTVGVGGLKEKMVTNHLYRLYEKDQPLPSDDELIKSLLEAGMKTENRKEKSGIVIRGIGDTDVRFGKCCGPLPGDEIVGFVTRGRGLTIHRTDCLNILHMDEFDRARLIEAQWHVENKAAKTYHTDLRLSCDDREGLLADISRVFSDEKVRVTSLTARTTQSEAIFVIGIEISNGEHLELLMNKLRSEQGVHEITRIQT